MIWILFIGRTHHYDKGRIKAFHAPQSCAKIFKEKGLLSFWDLACVAAVMRRHKKNLLVVDFCWYSFIVGRFVDLPPSEVPWRKTPALPAAESKERQMLVCDKIVPVQSNLRSTCSSNPLKVKTLIQVSLAPWQWFGVVVNNWRKSWLVFDLVFPMTFQCKVKPFSSSKGFLGTQPTLWDTPKE